MKFTETFFKNLGLFTLTTVSILVFAAFIMFIGNISGQFVMNHTDMLVTRQNDMLLTLGFSILYLLIIGAVSITYLELRSR